MVRTQIRNLPRRRPLFTFDPAAPRDGRDLYLFGGDYGTFDGKTAAKFFVPAASCLDELTYPAATGTSIPFRCVECVRRSPNLKFSEYF